MEKVPLLKALKQVSKISFRQEKILVIFFVITIFLNLFLWFFIFFYYKNLKEIVTLHYSTISGIGIDQIGPKRFLFEMPLIGLIILFLNFFFTNLLFQKGEKILGYFLIVASFLINLSLTAAAILILSV